MNHQIETDSDHRTRLAITHEGQLVIQHRVKFQTFEHGQLVGAGVRWKTAPIVQLDDKGEEIDRGAE